MAICYPEYMLACTKLAGDLVPFIEIEVRNEYYVG
jgi:hypothetical protein